MTKLLPPLPDLSKMDVAEKDQYIVFLYGILQELSAKIDALESKAALNSRNSSKPPSSDGLSKPAPKSLREPSGKKNGGQQDHQGSTLKRVETPDTVIVHALPIQCTVCAHPLPEGTCVETRQVFDIPVQRYEVTEHRRLRAVCTCGKEHHSVFPDSVKAPVQYGANIKALSVHLSQHQMLPLRRIGVLMDEMYGLPLSDASILRFNEEAQSRLAGIVADIGKSAEVQPVLHADETGMRTAGKTRWVHFMTTRLLTWMAAHAKRGYEAFAAFGFLTQFKGVLSHDGWASYWKLSCEHSLCNAHHLRELLYLTERLQQSWSSKLAELLLKANAEVQSNGGALSAACLHSYRERYDALLNEGKALNPEAVKTMTRGRTKQSKAFNLLRRLSHQAEAVWLFASHEAVPFTNNCAEQAVRMFKVKQKVSGGFRTTAGLDTFCTIRSYLATMQKHKHKTLAALRQTFAGMPPSPFAI